MFSADLLIGLRPFQDRKCKKLLFLGDIVNKFRSPSILQLNVEDVTARGGYFKTRLETRFPKSRSRNPKVSSRSWSRTTVSESTSRHCSDVGKAHRCCKYVIIFGKSRLFYVFLTIWAS